MTSRSKIEENLSTIAEKGLTVAAKELGISPPGLRWHLRNIGKKYATKEEVRQTLLTLIRQGACDADICAYWNAHVEPMPASVILSALWTLRPPMSRAEQWQIFRTEVGLPREAWKKLALLRQQLNLPPLSPYGFDRYVHVQKPG